jgi:FMN phosphatase YigB (HAD superfamily)
MPQSLSEYLDWLDDRTDLVWPKPPPVKPLKATPACAHLPGIHAVTWNPYGTLLRIDTGHLQLIHPQPLRMQIALQKTIEEFRMWGSMSRKPGQPWEYLLQQYTRLVEDARLAGTGRKGDVPEVDAVAIWDKLLERLERNEYQYDRGQYGNRQALALKVAYFFHASLQGVEAAEGAAETLLRLRQAGLCVGLLGEGQAFTVAQLLRALRQQRTIGSVGDVLTPDSGALSSACQVRPPSPSLYEAAVKGLRRAGLSPGQVLHISVRLNDDLVPARRAGFRTALLVADAHCTQVEKADIRDPHKRPDRLLTALPQVLQIVGI